MREDSLAIRQRAADAPTIVFPVIAMPDAGLPGTQEPTDAKTVAPPLTDSEPHSNSAPPKWADEARLRLVRTIVSRAVPPVAILLWLLSLRHVNLRAMGDLGLLQVLPVLFWVALGLLTLGFAVTLWAERIARVLPTVYVIALITILHATISVLYPTLRYQWSWKHVAVVDAMLRHAGPVTNPGFLDIYNYWPGFFVMNGFVLHFTGLQTAMGYARWATPAANVLMIGPLLLLYRTITRNRQADLGRHLDLLLLLVDRPGLLRSPDLRLPAVRHHDRAGAEATAAGATGQASRSRLGGAASAR